MGFTIQDMMLISQEQYRMRFIAGEQGWSNSISWVHMVEDTVIIQYFWGKELAVTTGLGFDTTEKLQKLIEDLIRKHAAGLIINTGNYIFEIPRHLIDYCNENDFPLLTIPWEIHLTDVIKDFSIRIFMQGTADNEISGALIQAIEQPANQEEYRQKLLPYFDEDGTFQVVLITTDHLDEMDTVERQKLSYRVQVYLEQITHNGNFMYYDSDFMLVVNDITGEVLDEIVTGMVRRAKRRMPEIPLYVGVGSCINDISNLHTGYARAKAAVQMAKKRKQDLFYFDRMGLYRLLYMVDDSRLLKEMAEEPLKPLLEYDRERHANYVDTLELYLKHNGSIQAVSEEMFTHRNTVIYRMNKIRELLGTNLEETEERIPYQIAYYIRAM
nr:PucR family transcriptional regulator [uncultured Schaedlerella sp.]